MRQTVLSLAMGACLLCCLDRGEGDLPAATRALPVPEARLASPEARARGHALFAEHCSLCHGARADGRGVRRVGLAKRPVDFTNPIWRRDRTPRRVFHAIRAGVRGSDMPGFRQLADSEVWDLVAYVLSVGERP
jgi:high-affinity iron transporter